MKSRLLLALGLVACSCTSPREQAKPVGHEEVPIVSVDWTPPNSNIDPRYVKMVKALLGNGLGDPRGGRFCEVHLEIPSNTRYPDSSSKHGWVLPDGKTVVTLNGLEYSIKSIVSQADINTIGARNGTDPLLRDASFFEMDSPAAAPAVLLVAGRADLAESTFKNFSFGRTVNPARDLSDYLFDHLKLHAAQALVANQNKVGLLWARRMAEVAEVSKEQGVAPTAMNLKPFEQTQFEFALDLYRYLAQRVKHDMDGYGNATPPTEVARLIKSMDMIEGRQVHKLSSAIDYTEDDRYDSILRLGNSAVPALIDALERDRRFTGFFAVSGGMSQPTYTIHPVPEIIAELLAKIWPSSPTHFTKDRVSTALALRKAWLVDSKKSQSERWADVLAADNSTPQTWLQAAQNLVSPRLRTWEGGMRMTTPDMVSPLKAESLQASRGVEIGALMAKRALEMAKDQRGDANDLHTCADALSLGECLGIWSPSTCVEPLKQLTHIAQGTILKWTAGHPNYGQACAEPYARVIVCRLKNGDRTAIADLSKVVQTFVPEPWVSPGQLKPFWMLPHDPEMQTVVEKYLGVVKKEILSPSAASVFRLQISLLDAANASPFLAMPSFRNMLAAGCANPSSGIEAWAGQHTYIEYSAGSGGSGSCDLHGISPDQPAGKHIAVTAGDYVAQGVSSLSGAPPYCMIWPAQRRQAAKEKLIKWLLDDAQDWQKIAESSPRYSEGDRQLAGGRSMPTAIVSVN